MQDLSPSLSFIATLLDVQYFCSIYLPSNYFYLLLVGYFHRFHKAHRNWFNEHSNYITSSTSVFPQRQQLQPNRKVGSRSPTMPHNSSIIYQNTGIFNKNYLGLVFLDNATQGAPPKRFRKIQGNPKKQNGNQQVFPTKTRGKFPPIHGRRTWARCRSGSTSASWRRRSSGHSGSWSCHAGSVSVLLYRPPFFWARICLNTWWCFSFFSLRLSRSLMIDSLTKLLRPTLSHVSPPLPASQESLLSTSATVELGMLGHLKWHINWYHEKTVDFLKSESILTGALCWSPLVKVEFSVENSNTHPFLTFSNFTNQVVLQVGGIKRLSVGILSESYRPLKNPFLSTQNGGGFLLS